MSEGLCRWGVLGTAEIAQKNWKAIWNASNATLTGVASRDGQRADAFIARCQSHVPFDPPPRVFGRYEALLAADSVDAVYIPLPTGLRKRWVIRAAEAGKHVLAEKPAARDADEVAEMLEACRQNGVQYMDGVMFMHSRRLEQLRRVLDDGESVGPIKRITSQFSFCAPEAFFQNNIRSRGDLEPQGTLGDLGWYNIRFVLWLMDWRLPDRVGGRILSELGGDEGPDSVPTEFSAELFYPDGVSASFYCSFVTGHQQWVHVSGTKGTVHVRDFVLPNFGSELAFEVTQSGLHIRGCDFNVEDHTRRYAVREYSNSAPDAQETNMVRRFSEIALSGRPDPWWGDIVLKTQQVMDACLRSARSGGDLVEV